MKTVLITGASRGIGRATVETFLSEGWKVFGVARNFVTPISHENFEEVRFDLSQISEISSLVEKIGKIDILVNNAGVMNLERDKEIIINMIAPIEMAIAFAHKMPEEGRIVSVASIAAQIGHPDVWYGATKAAIVNATKSLAKKFAGKIICNAVAPGPVDTDMLAQIPRERVDQLRKNSPTGRIATPGEIAATIYWLAVDAPKQINGEIVNINGGVS